MRDPITWKELAEELRVHPDTIRYWWRQGLIPQPTKHFGLLTYSEELAGEVRRFFQKRKKWERQ